MIISIFAEKHLTNSNPFMINNINKFGIKGIYFNMYFNMIKATYKKVTANILLHDG